MTLRGLTVSGLTILGLAGGGLAISVAPSAGASGRGGRHASIARGHPRHRRRPPSYTAKQPTRPVSVSYWDASYSGSVSWGVRLSEKVYAPDGPQGQSSINESSDVQIRYEIPAGAADNGGFAGFEVQYPTNCVASRGVPCPPVGTMPIGTGTEKGTYTINDSYQSPDPATTPSTSVACKGTGSLKINGAPFDISMTYVRASDAFQLAFDAGDASPMLTFVDHKCPAAGQSTAGWWFPTEGPQPLTRPFWVPKTVDLPAKLLATSGAIQIPLSLPSVDEPASTNCYVSPGNTLESCTIKGSWKGTLTLHRVKTS
jgi:hypothetical protein